MNTVEALFKNAQDVLDNEVFVPVVLEKLAQRGYKAETQEEAIELLKYASVVRESVRKGEIHMIPQSALEEDGSLSKQASEALEQDPFALADDFDVEFEKLSEEVRDAAAIGLCGFKMAAEEMDKEAAMGKTISKGLSAAKKYVGSKATQAGKAVKRTAKATGKAVQRKAKATGKAVKRTAKDTGKAVQRGAKKSKKYVEKQMKRPGVAAATAGAAGTAAGGAAGYAAGKSKKDD